MNHILPLSGALALAALAPAAWGHAALQTSTPAAHAALAAAPTAIDLRFSEAVEPTFSTIKLFDAKGKDVSPAPAKVDAADATRLQLALPAALPTGTYTVRWTTLAHDGHRSKGAFDFSVK